MHAKYPGGKSSQFDGEGEEDSPSNCVVGKGAKEAYQRHTMYVRRRAERSTSQPFSEMAGGELGECTWTMYRVGRDAALYYIAITGRWQ